LTIFLHCHSQSIWTNQETRLNKFNFNARCPGSLHSSSFFRAGRLAVLISRSLKMAVVCWGEWTNALWRTDRKVLQSRTVLINVNTVCWWESVCLRMAYSDWCVIREVLCLRFSTGCMSAVEKAVSSQSDIEPGTMVSEVTHKP
jgi:hypothetical protein